MCNPILIAAVNAAGTIMQGYAAKQQGEYSNQVAQYNARVQENEATQTRNLGVEEENRQRLRTAQIASQQRAQLGAAGVDIGSGSAAGLIEDTAMMGEADALRIKSNYGRQAESMTQQATLTRSEGAAKQAAGNAEFTSSLISGASSFASKWYTDSSAARVPPTQPAAPVTERGWGTLQ